MDIDQRLEKLAQRQQSVMRTMDVTEQLHRKNEEAQLRNEVLLARLMRMADCSTHVGDDAASGA